MPASLVRCAPVGRFPQGPGLHGIFTDGFVCVWVSLPGVAEISERSLAQLQLAAQPGWRRIGSLLREPLTPPCNDSSPISPGS